MPAWLLALLVTAVLPLEVANAQPAVGADVVTTPSGGRLRGTVTEYEPGQRVVIVMPDGTTRTLGPTEFATVTFGDGAAVVAPPPTPVHEAPLVEAVPVVATTTTPPVEPERWTETRAFVGPRIAGWDRPTVELDERRPHGNPHFGVQLEGSIAMLGSSSFNWAASPGLAAYAFLDITIDFDQTFRIGLVGDFFANGPRLDCGVCGPTPLLFGGPGVAVRALFGADLGSSAHDNTGVFRAGVEIGVAFPPDAGPGLALVPRFELGHRFLPQRTLEVGIAVSLGFRAFGVRYGPRSHGVSIGFVVPGVSLFLAWVFE